MALPPPPAGLDLSETQVPRIMGVNISTYVMATVAVALRFVCRRLTRARPWWDDWLMVPALLASAIILLTSLAWMVPKGLGVHIWVAQPDAALVWAKGLFIHEICYTVIICAVKYSVLLFYWRLFKQSKIRVPIYILSAIVACWGIAVILTTIFQCLPVNGFWDRFSPTLAPEQKAAFVCGVDVNNFFNGNSIPNIITDAAIVFLPIPFIWGLQLATAQKLAISSIFVLGAFVVGVSIARFTFIINLNLQSPDITWNFVNIQIWTAVECHIGIVCACLPSLRPLMTLALTGSVGTKARSGAASSGKGYRSGSGHDTDKSFHRHSGKFVTTGYSDIHPFAQISDQDEESPGHIKPSAPRTSASDMELGDMNSNGNASIAVKTDIYVQNQPRELY